MKSRHRLAALAIFCLLLLGAGALINQARRPAAEPSSPAPVAKENPPVPARSLTATKPVGKPRDLQVAAPIDVQAQADKPTLALPALDHVALIAKAKKLERGGMGGRYRFATARKVDARPGTHGRWVQIAEDRSRWELDIHSEGADSINLAFGEFRLPPGAQLRFSSNDSDTSFTFTDADNDSHGELWTPIIVGDSVSLELDIDNTLAPDMSLALASVNHGFRGFQDKSSKEDKIGDDSSGSCNVDVVCTAADNSAVGPLIDMYRDEIRSVGAYTVGGVDTCTGALINNTANDTRPFFLTANHCQISPSNAPSVVVYWNFQNTFCRQPGSSASGANGNGPLNQFNTGAIYRSGNGATDFNLIELDDPVSASAVPFFAGWNRSSAAPGSAIGIHHPSVSEKRISFELNATSTTSAYQDTGPGDGNYIRVADWDFGTTEPGSSGSPLFNSNGQIVGQLLGGSAACGNNSPDWYGRLSKSWTGGGSSNSRLVNWLDPDGTGAISIDGINSDQLVRVTSQTVVEGDTGTHDVALRVTLAPVTDETVTVRLRTEPGATNPATPGEDFIPVNTLVTFAPGVTSQTVNVTILTDTVPEENETIDIILSDPTNAIISSTPASIVIRNDEYSEPVITSDLNIQAPTQSIMRYRIVADGTPTFYSISQAPAGMRIDAMTGEITWNTPSFPGNFSVVIGTSNPVGSDSEVLRIEILGNSLANALDLASGISLTSTEIPWSLQTLETHDGFDAGRSAPIFHSLTSGFSINVDGPDAARFFWKVSSEESYDFLTVSVENLETGAIEEIAAISGEVDWTEVIVPVPEGSHRIHWAYTKDADVSEGENAGWVDEISLASSSGEPLIISPTELSVTLGDPFEYEVVSIDAAATLSATDLPPGLNFVGGNMITGTPTEAGIYNIPLSASNGQTSEITLTLAIVPNVGPSVEQPNLAWIPSGDELWFPVQGEGVEGASAGRSGMIGDNESSTLKLEVTGPDWVSFWWKVSSEAGYDFLRFDFDGSTQREISGDIEWKRVAVRIPPGNHTLEWIYEKDEASENLSDAGFLDNVVLASSNRQPFITSPDSTVAFEGEPFGYQITAVNAPETFGAVNLPSGLSIDASTGLITGQPNQAGRQEFTIWAENALGRVELDVTLNRATLDTAIPPALEQP
ncbi:MAG: putative Ig domain-containing protein, partial [Verrucomicrobiales bacterium]